MWHAMMEKYFKKRLEIELLYQDYWLGLYKKPMKGYSKNITTIFKAVQDWEYEESEKETKEANEEMEVLESEKRQMNQQFEISKSQKIEVVEDDVLLED